MVHMRHCAIASFLLMQVFDVTNGARILGLFPFQAKSHAIVNIALMLELASRGHQVTVVSFHPQNEPVVNYTDIAVKSSLTHVKNKGTQNLFHRKEMGALGVIKMLWNLSPGVCDKLLQEDAIQELIKSKELRFDLVIMEAFFNECFLGFVHKFKAPLIQTSTLGGLHWMGDWVGNPNPYSHVPDPFLKYSDNMDFWERTVNTLLGTFWRVGRKYYYLPQQDAIMKKHFSDFNDLPSVSEIEYKTALVFVNHHFSISYPRPLMPNLVQVGGLHIKPSKKLPQDLEKYLDDADDGVIYFSMGTNLKSSLFPESKRNAFLEVFSKLKQRVLWKWETDTLPGQPNNVKLGKWLPQLDILAHPNVRVFITHGGLLGTQEAINSGVPLIGIPIYGDQELNMVRAESAGFGILLDFENITTESVTWALKEIIDNPRYCENAKRVSRIYRDQPLTPLEQAVFWTEYVIRHKGAPHMRSAALDLTWYQYFLLDVIAMLALIVVAVLFFVYYVFGTILKNIFSDKKCNNESSNSHRKRD